MKECIEVGEIRVWPQRPEVYLTVDVGGVEFILTVQNARALIMALAEALAQMGAARWIPPHKEEE